MSTRQLSLSARPKSFAGLVGQQKVVKSIRGHFAGKRIVTSWLFTGPKGVGKTSLSRILALAYQCTHQTEFGTPCKECYENKAQFSIVEIDPATVKGIDDLRSFLSGANFGVTGMSRYRVYIVDECHFLSPAAQTMLLKYTEDSPATTVFILCSTDPGKIKDTLRSRCVTYELRELNTAGITHLVERLLKGVGSKLPADRLIDALIERKVTSPRLVTQAVEKYLAGDEPVDAASVEGMAKIDGKAIVRSIVKGDWNGVAAYLHAAKGTDLRALRLTVVSYLHAILLDSSEVNDSNSALAMAISSICDVQNAEDTVVAAVISAELYQLCAVFNNYKR